MFGNQLKRWAVLGLAATAWLAADTFSASAQITMMTSRRNVDRSNMWHGFANNGVSSSVFPFGSVRNMWFLSWPGSTSNACGCCANDFYWDYKPSGHCGQYENTAFAVGEGLVTLMQVGGEKVVSFTGPRFTTADVFPHIYDIQNGPEATWGIDTKSSLSNAIQQGESTANWWPGAVPLSGDPTSQFPYEIHNYDYGIYSPLQNTAETIVISEWESNEHAAAPVSAISGKANMLLAKRRVLAWSHQDLDDMIVYELVWTNISDQQATGAYFGEEHGFSVTQQGQAFRYGGHSGRHNFRRVGGDDDWIDWSEDPGFKGNSNFVGRGWHVQWDGDFPGSPDEDTGNPFRPASCWLAACLDPGWLNATTRPEGMPLSPEHVGFGALAWRSSGTGAWNPADAAAGYVEPTGEPLYHWWQANHNDIVDPADGSGPSGEADRYDAWTKPSDTPPQEVTWAFNDVLYGPYTMDPGDQVKLVLAYVVGTGSHVTINPTTGYPVDPWDWTYNILGAQASADAFRLAEMPKGHEGLWTNVSHALFAYSNEWQVPNTPPDVDFTVTNTATAQNLITVTGGAASAINPDYGTADVEALRIYVSEYAEYGPWILQTELPATGGSWVDQSSIAGFSKFYNVRSVASGKADWSEGTKTLADLPAQMASHVTGGMESGYSAPEQRTVLNFVPSQPATADADALDIPIRVVPNPLNIRVDDQSYAGELKIRFVGIPNQAKISIWSAGGDLVSTLYHRNPNSGEADFVLQNRTITSELMTGVYYWVVESLLPGASGKTQTGWMVIHR